MFHAQLIIGRENNTSEQDHSEQCDEISLKLFGIFYLYLKPSVKYPNRDQHIDERPQTHCQ